MRFLARGEGEVAKVREGMGEMGWICRLCLARSRIWGGRGFIVWVGGCVGFGIRSYSSQVLFGS